MFDQINKKLWGRKGEYSLYILLLVDCIERLDTLFFEARNLQVNIIHTLREPGLYLPLRFEEQYIFGQKYGSMTDTYPSNRIFSEICGKEIENWIIRYPLPKECNRSFDHSQTHGNQIEELTLRLKTTVKKMWFTGTWGEEQRRYYHFLRAIQILKRKIFFDKTVLCHFAYNESKIASIEKDEIEQLHKEQAKFLILRRAVLARSVEYLKRLRDIQYQFSKAMDSGLQDNPRPNIERRRELGIYMNFLADRCRDLGQEMTILLKYCGVKISSNKQKNQSLPTVLHSWTHDYTSTNASLQGCLSPFESRCSGMKEQQANGTDANSVFLFVNTNYWMPDHPSLQPIIAHEISHGIIKNYLGNLDDSAIQNGSDSFTELILMLEYCIKDMQQGGLSFNISSPRVFLREIACDFLGGAVKDCAYLYAQFLDTIGFDLEKILCLESHVPEIGMIHYTDLRVDENLHKPTEPPAFPEWYFRLYLLTVWVKQVHHKRMTCLDVMLIEGVQNILENLSDQLQAAAQGDRYATMWSNWKALSSRLVEIIEDSQAVRDVKNWRIKRSHDHEKQLPGGKKEKKGPQEMPRHVQRLLPAVVDFICRQREKKTNVRIASHKNNVRSSLHETNSDSDKFFPNRYGIKGKAGDWLFRHLHQIPWQSSLMRCVDFYEFDTKPENSKDFWQEIHFDCSLGRDMFTFALDFHYWANASPAKRLDRTISLVKHHIEVAEDNDTEIVECLRKWLEPFPEKNVNKTKKGKKTEINDYVAVLQATIISVCDTKNYLINDINIDSYKKQLNKISELDESINLNIDECCINIIKSIKDINKGEKIGLKDLACYMAPTVICKVQYRFDELYIERRKAEEIAGHKLEQLCCLLKENFIDNQSVLKKSRIFPLYSFLSNRRDICNSLLQQYHSDDILKSFSIKEKDETPSLKSYLLGRISASGSYARLLNKIYKGKGREDEEKHNIASFDSLVTSGKYELPAVVENKKDTQSVIRRSKKIAQQSLLGRYDILQGTGACPMSRCFLPHILSSASWQKHKPYEMKYNLEEKFLSFFVRREIAIPARLYLDNNDIELPWTLSDRNCCLWAVLAITMQKKSYRLDLLKRLLRTDGSKPETSSKTENEYGNFVEELQFEREDLAYMTDGWGDILLFLHGPNPEGNGTEIGQLFHHLYRITHIQNTLFEDFMTDRTELIPTPVYLGVAARVGQDGFPIQIRTEKTDEEKTRTVKLRISSRVRLMEDRLLWRSNKKYIKKLYDRQKKDDTLCPEAESGRKSPTDRPEDGLCTAGYCCGVHKDCPGINKIEISRIPGRMDFNIHFIPTFNHNHCHDFMNRLTRFLDDENVDRIDTAIGIEIKDT